MSSMELDDVVAADATQRLSPAASVSPVFIELTNIAVAVRWARCGN